MLPAGFVTVLGLIGLASAPLVSWTMPLTPFAPLLLILSVVVLVLGNSRCGWQPASLAAFGGLFVYLAMYVFITPLAKDTMSSMEGMSALEPSQTTMPGLTNASMFYFGLTLMVGSFGLVLWRRWRKFCRPFNPLVFLRALKQN